MTLTKDLDGKIINKKFWREGEEGPVKRSCQLSNEPAPILAESLKNWNSEKVSEAATTVTIIVLKSYLKFG